MIVTARRSAHLCYRFSPPKWCAGSGKLGHRNFSFSPSAIEIDQCIAWCCTFLRGVAWHARSIARSIQLLRSVAPNTTTLTQWGRARCGIVRHRRCLNPRVPRSTPSAYSRRGSWESEATHADYGTARVRFCSAAGSANDPGSALRVAAARGYHFGARLGVELGYISKPARAQNGPTASNHIVAANFFLTTAARDELRPARRETVVSGNR